MRCTRCNRILKTAAASVVTKAGTASYGMRCAVLKQLIPPPRAKTAKPRARRPRDTQQMPLEI